MLVCTIQNIGDKSVSFELLLAAKKSFITKTLYYALMIVKTFYYTNIMNVNLSEELARLVCYGHDRLV